jgi:hypothetical protein
LIDKGENGSKISGNSGSVFSYFLLFLYYSVNTVIGMKTGYDIVEISRNTIGFSYRPFLDWLKKFGNFLNFPHSSSGLSRTVHLGWVCYLFFNPKIFQIFK